MCPGCILGLHAASMLNPALRARVPHPGCSCISAVYSETSVHCCAIGGADDSESPQSAETARGMLARAPEWAVEVRSKGQTQRGHSGQEFEFCRRLRLCRSFTMSPRPLRYVCPRQCSVMIHVLSRIFDVVLINKPPGVFFWNARWWLQRSQCMKPSPFQNQQASCSCASSYIPPGQSGNRFWQSGSEQRLGWFSFGPRA